MYCAQSTIYHVGGGTLNAENPFKTYLNFRNNLLLLKKNLPFWRALFVISIRFCMDLLAIFRFLAEGKRKDAWAVSRAHQNFVLGIFGIHVSGYGVKDLGNGKNKLSPKTHKSKRIVHNLKGMYKNSIVWAFFVKKQTRFTDLDQADLI